MKYYISYPIDEDGMVEIAPGEVMSQENFVAMLEQKAESGIELTHGNAVRRRVDLTIVETQVLNTDPPTLRLTLADTAPTDESKTAEQWAASFGQE